MNREGVAHIKRRRADLKGKITKLRQAITRNDLDPTNVRLRFKRIVELFHEFEDLNLDLEGLAENAEEVQANAQQFEEVQDSFYELSTIVEGMQVASGSRTNTTAAPSGFVNSTFAEKQKTVKLPIADLPKFNGDYEEWISFKNEFKSMIDARTDIDDVTKFIYLRNSLTGSATKKLSLLDASAENYKVAWDTLTHLYEKTRILIKSHYNAIFDLAKPIQAASAEALSHLIDDAQQHLATLKQLKVVPDEGMIVCCLERSLPREVRQEWDKTLSPNVVPNFKTFYDFISDYVDRVHDGEKQSIRPRPGQSRKHSQDREPQGAKSRRSNSGARTLITDTTATCAHCKQAHQTFRCTEFQALNTQQRWDSIKASGACRNCLRFHQDACKSTYCKKCSKAHHTLLHADKSKSSIKDASNAKTVNEKNQTHINPTKTA